MQMHPPIAAGHLLRLADLRPSRARAQLDLLLDDLKTDGRWLPKKAEGREAGVDWAAAGYNAPFVLPWFKTNEVLVQVEETSSDK